MKRTFFTLFRGTLFFLTAMLLFANCATKQEEKTASTNNKVSRAVTNNKVSGTVTIDGKPVNLSHVYARRVLTHSKAFEYLALVLTNQPVPEDDMPTLLENFHANIEQQSFLSDKSTSGVVFIISKGWVPDFDIGYEGHVIKEGRAHFVLRKKFADFSMKKGVMKGKAEDEGAAGAEIERKLSDGKKFTYKYAVDFEATPQGEQLFKEREGAVPSDVPYLLSKQGKAEGTLTVDDKTVNLKYAYGLRKREFFDEPEEEITILATDKPLGNDVLVDVLYKGNNPTKFDIQGVEITIHAHTSKDFGIAICHKKIDGMGIISTLGAVEDLSITAGRITTKTSDTHEAWGHRWKYSVSVDVPFNR